MAARKKAKKRVQKKVAAKRGRPTRYSKALGARFCAHLAQGKSVRSTCQLKSMPTASTIFLWLGKHKEFSEQYETATSARADALVEDMLDIADDDKICPQDKRVRIDVRKWNAARMKHKRYGDKVAITGGDEDDQPIQMVTRKIID